MTCSASAKLIYTKTTGSDSNSGFSWTAAKKTVQGALNAASTGDQVWVAAGIYVNTSGSINLKNGVALYGGFPATEETGARETSQAMSPRWMGIRTEA